MIEIRDQEHAEWMEQVMASVMRSNTGVGTLQAALYAAMTEAVESWWDDIQASQGYTEAWMEIGDQT